MNAMVLTSRFLSVILAAALWTGCTGDSEPPSQSGSPGDEPLIVAIDPPDGSADVPTGASVGVRFDMPMDTASVASCFFLSGGEPMHAWMDSLGHHRGRMGRGMMNMGHMMAWMDTLCLPGVLHWNERQDSCYYSPRHSLPPLTDHMIYMRGTIRSRQGTRMDMSGYPNGGPMSHFRTGR